MAFKIDGGRQTGSPQEETGADKGLLSIEVVNHKAVT